MRNYVNGAVSDFLGSASRQKGKGMSLRVGPENKEKFDILLASQSLNSVLHYGEQVFQSRAC